MKKVAITQSNYIPWKGYFDLIASVDEFIIYDDMQYTKRDWRNRNKIKTPNGLDWLTVPVSVKGKYHQTIRETKINDQGWAVKHWNSICQNYSRTKYFDMLSPSLETIYLKTKHISLSALNRMLIEWCCGQLGINTKITNSWDYRLIEGKSERLIDLCRQAGAAEYVSGPTARDYIDKSIFSDQGIKLTWFDYSNYPEYHQFWGEFNHRVSILDLLFNCGEDSSRYMKFVNNKQDCHVEIVE